MDNKVALSGFIGLLFKGDKLLIGKELQNHMDKVALFVMAKDASSNESERLKKKILRAHRPFLTTSLTKEEMGEALGRDEVTFIGITDKKAAFAFIEKTNKKI